MDLWSSLTCKTVTQLCLLTGVDVLITVEANDKLMSIGGT